MMDRVQYLLHSTRSIISNLYYKKWHFLLSSMLKISHILIWVWSSCLKMKCFHFWKIANRPELDQIFCVNFFHEYNHMIKFWREYDFFLKPNVPQTCYSRNLYYKKWHFLQSSMLKISYILIYIWSFCLKVNCFYF